MNAIGIDLSERGLLAVAIDARGAVLRTAASGDIADLARVVRDVSVKGPSPAVGVAADPIHRTVIERALPKLTPRICSPGSALVVAETWVGAAKDARHAICLWIGDRVFAGIMLDSQPWSGAHGLAGSAAWLALNPVERQDYRKFGSLAAEVSNNGIARRLSWRIQSGDRSEVLERAGGLDAITAAHVFEGARAGDGVAISVVRDTAKYIGMAIANLASAIDPEFVVLGGDLAEAGDLLFEPIAQECSRRLPPSILPVLRIELSTLGTSGVAVGAARHAALQAA
ncbi:MAG TPA: ROK family protein [Vicinamibacterales bacterium]|nr:ROK family protein [Vicinamibacterales bacterium]